jgi:hypothetical protein
MSSGLLDEIRRVAERCATRAAATILRYAGRLPESISPAFFGALAVAAPPSISTGMSDLQAEVHAAMAEVQRAHQKKRAAAEALRARQHEYEAAYLRGRRQQIMRARAALEAAQAAYDVAKREVQRFDDKAEEVVQAQVRAAYM